MKRAWTLSLLGIIAFLIFLAATLPARLLLDRVPQVQATGVSGSIWSGRASTVSLEGRPLGALTWRMHALPLFTGRAQLDAELTRDDGTAVARCVARLSGSVHCNHIVANLPLAALPIAALPVGWTGRIDANFSELQLMDGWPVAANGTVNMQDVAQPDGTPIGSYQVQFPASTSEPVTENTLVGAVQDTGGPLEIAGVVRLTPDRTYSIDAKVAARPDAPPNVARTLQFLGPPDAQGRYDFAMSGTL